MDYYQVDAAVLLVLATVQNGIAHNPRQACMPNAFAMAVNTVTQ